MRRFLRADGAAASPIPVMAIVLLTLTFQAMLFGADLAARSFPDMSQGITSDDRPDPNAGVDCSNFWNVLGCVFRGATDGLVSIGVAVVNLVTLVINFFKIIWGVVAFIFALVTFDVPGAPWFVRFIVGGLISGSLIWSVASMVRGN